MLTRSSAGCCWRAAGSGRRHARRRGRGRRFLGPEPHDPSVRPRLRTVAGPLRGRRASRLSAHSQRPQFRSRPAGGRPPTLHAFPRKGGTSMSSAVSKPLQSSGERMQGYACLAAAMALVGSTVVASKIIAAGLPFHRHRAALRAGAALLPPDHETDRRVPAPTRRARLGVADGAGRRRQRGLHGAAHHRPAARLGGGRRHHPGRIAAGVRRPGRDAAGRTARPRHAGRDRDRHGGRMADDGQPRRP